VVQSIAQSRIVPVTEDLAADSSAFEILRGLEQMYRRDYEIDSGVELLDGEYAVLNASLKLVKCTGTPVANSYLVFLGTDRFDVAATGKATVIQNSALLVKTTIYKTTDTYTVGAALTVKLDGGVGKVALAAGVEPIFGRVTEVGTNYLVYESVRA